MARIKITLFGALREKLGWDSKVVEIPYNKCSFRKLLDMIPELRDIMIENNKIKEGFIVLVDGIHIQFKGGLDAEINDGDEISIFPPGGGG
ncbi:MoaD/ThiS family protein [Desulfurococcaceae archaeon MEX13E-LK6-19]|nr:MoaD/ThiS family protein [Desulfurococcaceae archaeon MEX13E-LK6-19]